MPYLCYIQGMKTKRHSLTLRNGHKLAAVRDWMQRSIPGVRLTLSQAADAVIESMYKVAAGSSMYVHIPTFEKAIKAMMLRGTIEAAGRLMAGFGMSVDIKATPDGQIVATRLTDGKAVEDQVFGRTQEEQVQQAARLADESSGGLRVN